MKIKKKDRSCILFIQKIANRSSLFDQKKLKKGTLFGRFFQHSENTKIKKKDKGRERERQLARTLERNKENVQIKQNNKR